MEEMEEGGEGDDEAEPRPKPTSPTALFSIRSSFMGGDSMKSMTQSSKFLNRIRGTFAAGYSDIGRSRSRSDDSGSDLEMSAKSRHSIKPNGSESPSTKAKRFVSQDRMMRAELRRSLIRTQSKKNNISVIQETVEEIDPVTSMLDVERLRVERVEQIVAQRKAAHLKQKSENALNGIIDVVQINSGPPVDQLPSGYALSSVVPGLTPQELTGKRVMVLWEEGVNDNERKINGWFLGSISGPSKMKNCNFNVKYDRSETGNLFVDGVENMMLTLSGENAYGRRWVLVHKVKVKEGEGEGEGVTPQMTPVVSTVNVSVSKSRSNDSGDTADSRNSRVNILSALDSAVAKMGR
eukprot:gene34407-42435_t